jgi:hypothetical protein
LLSSFRVRSELVAVLIGERSPSYHVTESYCFFQADPAWAALVDAQMAKAIDYFYRHPTEPSRVTLELQERMLWARALVAVGRREDAIARLQEGLDHFPTAQDFSELERQLREILSGKERSTCQPLGQ